MAQSGLLQADSPARTSASQERAQECGGGARSGLWFEYWRLISDLQPRFAIMENVGALTFRGLDAVLGSLAEIGYNAEWQDIRASDMGAPHKRERIWIIAYPNTASYRRQWFEEDAKIKEGLQQRSEYSGELEGGFKGLCKNVADTGQQPEGMPGNRFDSKQQQCEEEKFWSGQRDRFTDSGENVSNDYGKRFKEQYNGITERSGDFNGCDAGRKAEHSGWSVEPAVGRLVNGLPGRVDRLKGLGNAIVPQIAELLFNQIKVLVANEPRMAR